MNYKLLLDHILGSLTLPADVVNCRDLMCKIHKDAILEYLDSVIDSMHIAASWSIPVICMSNKKKLPGWNSYVKYYKEKSIWWNDVWKAAGCPSIGQLADVRRFARTNYHNAIKYINNNIDSIIRQKVANCLNNKSTKYFWCEIKKIKGANNITVHSAYTSTIGTRCFISYLRRSLTGGSTRFLHCFLFIFYRKREMLRHVFVVEI